jgi:hypothetical protein
MLKLHLGQCTYVREFSIPYKGILSRDFGSAYQLDRYRDVDDEGDSEGEEAEEGRDGDEQGLGHPLLDNNKQT